MKALSILVPLFCVSIAVACGSSSDGPAAPENPHHAITSFHASLGDTYAVSSARSVARKVGAKSEDEIRDALEYCINDGFDESEGQEATFAKQVASIKQIADPSYAKVVEYTSKSWELSRDLVEQAQAICKGVKKNESALEAMGIIMLATQSDLEDVNFELEFELSELADAKAKAKAGDVAATK